MFYVIQTHDLTHTKNQEEEQQTQQSTTEHSTSGVYHVIQLESLTQHHLVFRIY